MNSPAGWRGDAVAKTTKVSIFERLNREINHEVEVNAVNDSFVPEAGAAEVGERAVCGRNRFSSL